MSLISDIVKLLGTDRIVYHVPPAKTEQVTNLVPWQRQQAIDWSYDNVPQGPVFANQADLYRTLSWISTAIDVISDKASITKLSIEQMDGEDEVDIPNHPFEKLLRQPNPMMSRFEFIKAVVAYYKLNGNGVIWWNRPSATAIPVEAWIIPYNQIRPVPDGNMYLKGYIYTSDSGYELPLEPWEITHFKRFNPGNPFVGLSAIEAIQIGAMNDLRQQEFSSRLYGENNGRLPGILAYGDTIPDDQWEKMKSDAARASKMRNFLMLRGVGVGGVQWLQNNVSPKDMEFLGQRTFTKEEIWGVLAPGLASVMAINATEANSVAGMGTLIDIAIWPMLVMMSEKLNNDIMPVYGENVYCEFDDIRLTNKTIEMAETAEYGKYHTIDEVRAKFYKDDPLENKEVGNLLPAQVGQSTGKAVEPPPANPALPAVTQPVNPPEPAQAEAVPPVEIPAKAVKELEIWQRKAIKNFREKGIANVEFKTDVIPVDLQRAVSLRLSFGIKSVEDIVSVFDDIQAAPIKIDSGYLIAQAINRASDLLEVAK